MTDIVRELNAVKEKYGNIRECRESLKSGKEFAGHLRALGERLLLKGVKDK